MSCGCGKSTFATRGKAEQAVAGIRRHGEQRDKTPRRPYPCPTGKGWHLTSLDGDRPDAVQLRKSKAERKRRR